MKLLEKNNILAAIASQNIENHELSEHVKRKRRKKKKNIQKQIKCKNIINVKDEIVTSYTHRIESKNINSYFWKWKRFLWRM